MNGYLGFGIGSANYSENSFDDSDTGFSIYGGIKANEHFGLELSYTDFGEQEGTFTFFNYTYDTDVKASGLGLSVIGLLPINDNFNLFVKAGMIALGIDVGIASFSVSDDSSEPLFGFGAEYQLTDQFSLRGAWEMVDIEGADLDMLSINAQFNF
jgi:OOP family OmpA-OmpF porin